MKRRQCRAMMEWLETRELLSGTTTGSGTSTPPPPSAAVQADIAKIKADQQTFANDKQQIATDQVAIQAAIANAIKAPTARLNSDYAKWEPILNADKLAIQAATHDATRHAAQEKYTADRTASSQVFLADQQAIQAAGTNDPVVKAANAKLQSDYGTAVADQAALKTDYIQLIKDQKAQGIGDSSGTIGTPTAPPSAAVQADITKFQQDKATLNADKATLAADQNAAAAALAAAIKAPTTQLYSDYAKWEPILNADKKAIQAATNDTARQAAQTRYNTDYAAAMLAVTADQQAIQAAANSAPVKAANAKVAADLNAVAADQAMIQADYNQLIKDEQASQGTPSNGGTN